MWDMRWDVVGHEVGCHAEHAVGCHVGHDVGCYVMFLVKKILKFAG